MKSRVPLVLLLVSVAFHGYGQRSGSVKEKQADTVNLNAITVSAQRKLIQKTPEGFVVDASSNITQSGGTATDLLRSTPTVNVDEDGNVTLRGQTPLILIDGRNSAFTNTDQIAASSVESIEIINNPSAKYDASAESGIINIKLKKNKLRGMSGGVTVGAGIGARGRFNSSVFLGRKTEKWNLGIAYDNRFAGRTRTIESSRTNFADTIIKHRLAQERHDWNFDQLQNLKFNADFTPDKKNIFGFQVIGNMSGHDNSESLNSAWYTQADSFISNTNRHSSEIERPLAAESTLSYERKYADERKSLSSSVTVSHNRFRQNTDINSQNLDENDQFTGEPYYERTHDYDNTTVTTALFDYAVPVSSRIVFDAGYKGRFRNIRSDFLTAESIGGVYVPTPSASDLFKFNEQVHAVYGQFNGYTGKKDDPKWRYRAGLRAEQVFNDGSSRTADVSFSNSYINFFPSANVAYYLNPDEFWKVSYSKRINYPDPDELNPFLDVTDSLNQHGGNPYLKPEIGHSAELGYSRDWKNYSLTSTLFFRYTKDDIQRYSQLQPDGVTIIARETNIGSVIRYGWENIFYMHPVAFYDATLSLTMYQRNIRGTIADADVSNSGFTLYGKLINNFNWRNSRFQLALNYNSPSISAQGRSTAVYYADFGFRQRFGKNVHLGVAVTDVFNTLKSGYTTRTADYTSTRIMKSDTRAILFSFAYVFNTALKEDLLENKFSDE